MPHSSHQPLISPLMLGGILFPLHTSNFPPLFPVRKASLFLYVELLSLFDFINEKITSQILLHKQHRSLFCLVLHCYNIQLQYLGQSGSLLVEFPFAIPSVFLNFFNSIALWKKQGFWVNNFSSLEALQLVFYFLSCPCDCIEMLFLKQF